MIIIILLLVIGVVLHQRYMYKRYDKWSDPYPSLQTYLYQQGRRDIPSTNTHKPIMWIHIPHEYNARHWSSFGSRSSCDLNQPYLHMTVRSVLAHCESSFFIMVIDDTSFSKLLPTWSISLETVPEPSRTKVRQLALCKLLHRYGGMCVPLSFLCFRDLEPLYQRGTAKSTMFVCENVDANITSTTRDTFADCRFMGCLFQSPVMQQFIEYQQRLISSDATAQSVFLGELDRWCQTKIQQGAIHLIRGTDVGTTTTSGTPILLDNWMEEATVDLYDKGYGIWIPADALLHRRKYEWFCRSSEEQILQGKCILSRYFLITLGEVSKKQKNKEGLQNTRERKIEIEYKIDDGREQRKNDNILRRWITFWKVPLTNGTLNIWGPMPQNLGNSVPHA